MVFLDELYELLCELHYGFWFEGFGEGFEAIVENCFFYFVDGSSFPFPTVEQLGFEV